jgi:5-methylcytosine-specific restriction endonuclease McrA
VPASIKNGRKREKNVFVDHIEPIVNPETGFTSWDAVIERMFCEADNLQLLCKTCHDEKTKQERATAAEARKKE